MDPPTIAIPIATPVDPTSQSSNSPTAINKLLKGWTNYEKGSHYLQLSLETLDELASLSEHEHLSASQKASCDEAYRSGRILSEETIKIRNQLLTQKKSFRKYLVNLFVRESKTKHFYKISYRNYSSIRRTSDDLNRLLVSEINTILRNLGEPAQCNQSVTEGPCVVVKDLSPNENTRGINLDVHTEQDAQETGAAISGEEDDRTRSPHDLVEDNLSTEALSPNESVQGINLNVNTEQEAQEAFAILDRLGITFSREEEDDDDDDDQTIRPSTSQSIPPSPSRSCTINIYINQSVVSFDSESTGTTMNIGVNGGAGSSSGWHTDTNRPPSQSE